MSPIGPAFLVLGLLERPHLGVDAVQGGGDAERRHLPELCPRR